MNAHIFIRRTVFLKKCGVEIIGSQRNGYQIKDFNQDYKKLELFDDVEKGIYQIFEICNIEILCENFFS